MSQKIKGQIYDLLKEIKAENPPNSRQLMNEIARTATVHFGGDKAYTANINNLIKGRAAIEMETKAATGSLATNPNASSKFKSEWTGGKTTNSVSPSTKVAPVVDSKPEVRNEASSEDWPTIDDLIGLDALALQELFKNSDRIKAYAKELAWPLNFRLGAAKFTQAFADYVADQYGPSIDLSEEE